VDTVRDLGRVEPWRESRERSLARRDKSTRSPLELDRPRRQRVLDHDEFVREPVTSWPLRSRAIAKRSTMLLASAGGIFTLALLAATLPGVFDGDGASGRREQAGFGADARPLFATGVVSASARGSAAAPHARGSRAAASRSYAGAGHGVTGVGAGVNGKRTCQPVVRSSGYVNPLAGARVTPERIDQGVDYSGSGRLTAIGAARVTYAATSGTGWPGAFLEYQLVGGPDAGCYVYYAEGVSPAPGLRVGERLRAGQAVATIIPGYSSGIEIGWGARVGTTTYAAKKGEWNDTDDADNVPSAAGKSFSALIASLSGPPGKVEG
jgi:hypothetical protein